MSAPPRPDVGPAGELLCKAALCYLRAGWRDDACRLYIVLHDDRSAAPLLEEQGRFRQAAACHERLGRWDAAARCYLRNEDYDLAAEAFDRAGNHLRAAWIWADQAGRPTRAEAAIREAAAEPGIEEAAVDLVRSRCHVAAGRRREAARLFRTIPARLAAAGELTRYLDWLLEVAQVLSRPDLVALVHAAAYRVGAPGTLARWRDWARDTLGDAAGVPPVGREPDSSEPATSEPEGTSHDD